MAKESTTNTTASTTHHFTPWSKRKMRYTIFAIIAIVIGAFALVIALHPSEFRVTRTARMAAPAPDVFAQVNDFHKWEAWSPWAKMDPTAKNTFEGPSSGEGAKFRWQGNKDVGEGAMPVPPANVLRRQPSIFAQYQKRRPAGISHV